MNLLKVERFLWNSVAGSGHIEPFIRRHGRACRGHPRPSVEEDVDARAKRGHDGGEAMRAAVHYFAISIFVTVYWPFTCSASYLILLPTLSAFITAGSCAL